MSIPAPLEKIQVGNALDWPDFPITAAVVGGDIVYASGIVGIDPISGDIVEGGIKEQTRQVFENLDLILAAAGSDRARVLRIEAFLQDIRRDFEGFNEVYREFLGDHSPARYSVGATLAVEGLLVEVVATAIRH